MQDYFGQDVGVASGNFRGREYIYIYVYIVDIVDIVDIVGIYS